jgi:hypothetical protein
MVSENKSCDPDDVVCQLEVLRHLKGLEEQMGSEKFLEKYPELAPLKKRLPGEIAQQQQVVDSGIEVCGTKEAEETATVEDIVEETAAVEGESGQEESG